MLKALLLSLALVAIVGAAGVTAAEPAVTGTPASNPLAATAAKVEKVVSSPSTPLTLQNKSPASTPVSVSKPADAAPAPPAGAVPKISAAIAAAKAKAKAAEKASKPNTNSFLNQLKAQNSKAKLTLNSEFLSSLQQRVEAIQDLQDASESKKESAVTAAKKTIAENIRRVLKESAKMLEKAKDGKITVAEIHTQAEKRAAALAAASKPGAPTKPLDAAAQKAADLKAAKEEKKAIAAEKKEKAKIAKEEKRRDSFSGRNNLDPHSYATHEKNPKHKLPSLNAAAPAPAATAAAPAAAVPAAAARFQQVESESFAETESSSTYDPLQVVDQIMGMNEDGSQKKVHKGHVSSEGKLCPGCQPIVYNTDSPMSANDKKIMRAQYSDVVLKGVKLHSQETLDRAVLAADDADVTRKALLDKYPPQQESLLQLASHN